MEIFVLRHGHAEPEAASDSLRPLSLLGIQEVRAITSTCSQDLSRVKHVFVSPYLRAQQTFDVARESLPDSQKVDSKLITPCGNPQAMIDFLLGTSDGERSGSILLISHQPFVSVFVDTLCGLDPGCYRMGTAALAAIDAVPVAAGCGSLRWLRHPFPQ